MGPSVYWKWLQYDELTRSRENLQPFIRLGPWATGAVRALLERLNLNDSSSATDMAMAMTGGWYISLSAICQLKENNKDWTELDQFSEKFFPLTKLNKHNAVTFINSTGVLSQSWALPLLKSLIGYQESRFDQVEIEVLAEESGLKDTRPDTIKRMIRWLCDLNILEQKKQRDSTTPIYRVVPEIQHSLAYFDIDE